VERRPGGTHALRRVRRGAPHRRRQSRDRARRQGRGPACSRYVGGEELAAGLAEATIRGVRRLAGGAREFQRPPTASTEPGIGGILPLASRTGHMGVPLSVVNAASACSSQKVISMARYI